MSFWKSSWKTWTRWLAVVTVFAIACGFLSNWQLNRRAEKLVVIERTLNNYAKASVSIDELLPSADTWNEELEWRAVTVSGVFLPEQSLLVRNRPNAGQPGFEQLVPFRAENGRTLIVSRGWIPTGNLQDSPDVNPLPSSRPRTIEVRLRPSENPSDKSAPTGQIPNIEVTRVIAQLPAADFYTKTYGRLIQDSTGEAQLVKHATPATSEGNNFSYAIQWIVFALMAFAALFWMIRLERDRYLGIVRTKVRKRKSDEEIEDAL